MTTSEAGGSQLRRRRQGHEEATAGTSSKSPPTPNNNASDEKQSFDTSWEEIVSSIRIVGTRKEALESVVSPEVSLPKILVLKSFKRFWIWHLPLLARACVAWTVLRTVMLYWKGEEMSLLLSITAQIVRDIASTLGLSKDKSLLWIILGLFARFILVSMMLLCFRIFQRLSWRTTELGTYLNVKDDVRYQDEELLKNAWSIASRQGWKDPTMCSDFVEGIGGGAVLMQPRPGFCGIATLNSTLRSFGSGVTGDNNAPYVKLHSHPRYVTLEEMVQLVQRVIDRTATKGRSEWEKAGGSPVDSMQVVGGGTKGLASLEQFKAALRQLSHPTQPARIMAIYHRSPLFFCSKDKPLRAKLASFGMVHWSPVLGYLEEENLVLVMDVNHTYGPRGYLLSTERFYDSVQTRDLFTGNYHGLILLRSPPPKGATSLLTTPKDFSVAFGNIKRAYYLHQAVGRNVSAADILKSNEGGYEQLEGNEKGEKCIRELIVGDVEPLSAVISAHPAFFANEIFLDRGRVPTRESVRSVMDVFAKLCVPARLVVRGANLSTASDLHNVLIAAGMVQLLKSARVMFLNLEPMPLDYKSSRDMLPSDYNIEEISRENPSKVSSERIKELAKLIVASYKIPNIIRRGMTPCDFYEQAYQTFEHGGNMRHFACIECESGEMVACVTLFCERSSRGNQSSTRPEVAAIFNVCTSSKHRRKGLGVTMTLCAMEEAKKMGCNQVILEASMSGKPLYESMGFVAVEEDLGGVYVSLSSATESFKWKNIFRLFELALRIKNGGLWYYSEQLRRWAWKG